MISKVEKSIVLAVVVVSLGWAGILVAVAQLRKPSVTSPTVVAAQTNSVQADNAGSQPVPSAVSPGVMPFLAGPETSAAPAILDGLPTPEERKDKILEFWDKVSNGGNAQGPHGRWEERTGVVVPTTAPSESSAVDPIAPSLVTVHFNNLNFREALIAFAKQTGIRLSVPANSRQGVAFPTFSLDADKKPLLEVVNEFSSKAGLSPYSVQYDMRTGPAIIDPARPRMILDVQQQNNGLGPWEVTGDFSFEAQQILHSSLITTSNAIAGPLQLTIRVAHEPRIVVLGCSRELTITEAVDNKGNQLASASSVAGVQPRSRHFWSNLLLGAQRVQDQAGQQNWEANRDTLIANLSCPIDAGRKIVRFRATEDYLVQTKSEKQETPIANNRIEAEKIVGKIGYVVGPFNMASPQQYSCQVKFVRKDMNPLQWQQFSAAATALRPVLLDQTGKPITNMQNFQSGMGANDVTLTLNWYLNVNDGTTRLLQTPAKLVLDLPTELMIVHVPIEFDNLPLP